LKVVHFLNEFFQAAFLDPLVGKFSHFVWIVIFYFFISNETGQNQRLFLSFEFFCKKQNPFDFDLHAAGSECDFCKAVENVEGSLALLGFP
jgi:hypothetical protein